MNDTSRQAEERPHRTVRIDEEIMARVEALAQRDRRSLRQQTEFLLSAALGTAEAETEV